MTHHLVSPPFLVALILSPLLALGCGSSSSNGSGNGSGNGANDSGDDSSALSDGSASSQGDDGGGGVIFNPSTDGSAPDAATCSQVNIGILGLAGPNTSSNFQAWLVQSGTTVTRFQTTTTDPLTAAELAPFDVVILDEMQRNYTPDEAATFAAWFQAGGGVASMTGYTNDISIDFRPNDLLATMGVAYVAPLMNGPVTQFATHPITAGLTSVTFLGGYAITDLGAPAATRTPIAFLPDPSDGGVAPVGFAVTMGNGHAFTWGDEWIEYDSEWSTIPQIKQLWVQVFGWIAPSKCALNPPK